MYASYDGVKHAEYWYSFASCGGLCVWKCEEDLSCSLAERWRLKDANCKEQRSFRKTDHEARGTVRIRDGCLIVKTRENGVE